MERQKSHHRNMEQRVESHTHHCPSRCWQVGSLGWSSMALWEGGKEGGREGGREVGREGGR